MESGYGCKKERLKLFTSKKRELMERKEEVFFCFVFLCLCLRLRLFLFRGFAIAVRER